MALALKQMLSALTKMQVDLIINDNRSSMISVLERNRKYVRVSVHRMFLTSSNSVIIALADLLRNKRGREHNRVLRNFIDQSSIEYDSKHTLDKTKLISKGDFFDLEKLYEKVNREYFNSELNLSITWFGKKNRIPRTQITFGLYQDSFKLVKINRLLDQKETPSLFIEYIIYHEMLHEVYRPETNIRGYRRIHTATFREKEKEFLHYHDAKTWESSFKKVIFK